MLATNSTGGTTPKLMRMMTEIGAVKGLTLRQPAPSVRVFQEGGDEQKRNHPDNRKQAGKLAAFLFGTDNCADARIMLAMRK